MIHLQKKMRDKRSSSAQAAPCFNVRRFEQAHLRNIQAFPKVPTRCGPPSCTFLLRGDHLYFRRDKRRGVRSGAPAGVRACH